MTVIGADGMMNTMYQGYRARIQPPTVSARKYPDEIMMPKMPPKVPRSRTWNQGELTFTTDRAPKDWKYWLTAYNKDMPTTIFVCQPDRKASPTIRLMSALPMVPM